MLVGGHLLGDVGHAQEEHQDRCAEAPHHNYFSHFLYLIVVQAVFCTTAILIPYQESFWVHKLLVTSALQLCRSQVLRFSGSQVLRTGQVFSDWLYLLGDVGHAQEEHENRRAETPHHALQACHLIVCVYACVCVCQRVCVRDRVSASESESESERVCV